MNLGAKKWDFVALGQVALDGSGRPRRTTRVDARGIRRHRKRTGRGEGFPGCPLLLVRNRFDEQLLAPGTRRRCSRQGQGVRIPAY